MLQGCKMNILLLISSTGLYGAEKVVLTLAVGLQSKGHKVVIANICKKLEEDSAIIREAKTMKIESIEFHCTDRKDSKAIQNIRTYLRKRNIDIVHSHGYKSNYYALKASKGLPLKLVATCHLWTSNNLKMRFYEFIDKRILKYFNSVVTVSNQLYQKLDKAKMPKEKLRVIYNGIEIQANNRREAVLKKEYNIAPDVKCIGTVGRLSHEKGQKYLIRAFKHLCDKGFNTVLFIVGEGPLKGGLQKEINKLKIQDKVIFTGYRTDINNILISFDVFVLPSLKEGAPIILLEAMLAKKVIVATEVGETPNILGENGILCLSGDENILENNLIRALLMSAEEKDRIGENVRNTVLEKYSQEKMVNEYEKVYKGLLS